MHACTHACTSTCFPLPNLNRHTRAPTCLHVIVLRRPGAGRGALGEAELEGGRLAVWWPCSSRGPHCLFTKRCVTGCCHLLQAVVICTYTACRCGCIDCSALTIGLTALAEQLGHRCPPPQACTLPVWMLRGAWRCGLWRVGHCWLNGGCLVQLQASVGIPQPMHCC